MNDFTGRVRREDWHPPNGFRRTVTVAMDTAQYQMDITHMQASKGEDLYGTFNMVMRRKPKVCGAWHHCQAAQLPGASIQILSVAALSHWRLKPVNLPCIALYQPQLYQLHMA